MVHMIGNAHIDPVWLWRWREGYQEIKATFLSALDRLSETDGFVFTCACADYYRWVEENAPDMFAQIVDRVRQQRWRIVGGMWIQPDCNMPSGEAFARQLLYSQRYFFDKFGVTVTTGYNVDSFGHSNMLPQILKNAGIDNYVFMRPSARENAELPAPIFDWVSPDGSSVTTFRIIDGYESPYGDIATKIDNALKLSAQTGLPMMSFYGVGNHGGGPTIKNIASILSRQTTSDQVIFSDPDSYFDAVKATGIVLPKWRNELQHHASGCYSATSLIKKLNRRTENALIRAEIFGALSHKLTGHALSSMKQGWHNLMFNQFHDILCGCSIREAYEDAADQLGESASIAAREENAALQKISWRVDTMGGIPGRKRSKESHFMLWELDGLGTPVVVFNPHAFEAVGSVVAFGEIAKVSDNSGAELPVQVIRASRTNNRDKWDSVFLARVPAMGYRLYWLYLKRDDAPPQTSCTVSATEQTLENARIIARFDKETGAMCSLKRKDNDIEVLSAPALARMIDIEHVDTWAHAMDTFDRQAEVFGAPIFEVLESGPVRARVRVVTRVGASTLAQEYTLYDGADQVEVAARLDMGHPFRMVKLCFPVTAQNAVSRAETAYGMIERASNGTEEICHRYLTYGNDSIGIGILNDSKYSYSAHNDQVRLTVANTSIYADHYGQDYRDSSCIHADMGVQEFRYAVLPISGDWRTCDIPRRAELFNRPMEQVVETYHAGDLPGAFEGLSVPQRNITVGAVKRAEDDAGFVLRMAETMGTATQCAVHAPLFGRDFTVHLNALQFKTIYLPDDPHTPCREVLLTEW